MKLLEGNEKEVRMGKMSQHTQPRRDFPRSLRYTLGAAAALFLFVALSGARAQLPRRPNLPADIWVKEDSLRDLSKALRFHASFDSGPDADFGFGNRKIYTAASYKALQDSKPGIGNPDVVIAKGQGRFGDALQFRKKNTMAVFFWAENNVPYSNRDWKGTISFWLNLTPDEDLAPGYCDPIQVTDKAFNNAAIWTDFTRDDKPRHFRLGLFGDLKVWNPKGLPPEQDANFNQRTIVVTQPPFTRGKWTHVVITWTALNTKNGGVARLYLNGQPQGSAKDIREPFTWNESQSTIRLGVNYVGLWDELSVFGRALGDKEVETLYQLKHGVGSLRK
jgi:hypothetical protein